MYVCVRERERTTGDLRHIRIEKVKGRPAILETDRGGCVTASNMRKRGTLMEKIPKITLI